MGLLEHPVETARVFSSRCTDPLADLLAQVADLIREARADDVETLTLSIRLPAASGLLRTRRLDFRPLPGCQEAPPFEEKGSFLKMIGAYKP